MSKPKSSHLYRKNYDFIINTYGEDYIKRRCIFWRNVCRGFIEDIGLSDKLLINHELLVCMIMNYFVDILRLKNFHEIKRVHKVKVYAYSIFWLLRASPVQILNNDMSCTPHINEKIAVWVISSLVLRRKPSPAIDEETLKHYEDEIFYFFKYRHYTAQSIEMMIASLYVGRGDNPFSMLDKKE